METIKRVHIIYKTHLDIGFTDFSTNVIENYLNNFIPKAIELAQQVNTEERKKFVWSVGAWIVDYYLRHTDGIKHQAMVEAIQKGYISWHGMPFTPHCEIMDESLFKFGLSIGQNLDVMFDKKTKAAKMTDVPGHTAGIIKYLTDVGIEYLHIGINDASALPDTPLTFVWRSPEGEEILVDYCQGYGKEKPLDFGEDVLYFAHSGDNLGPPTKEEIEAIYDTVQKKYPSAEVFGSGLDAYAKKILQFKDKYPIIDQEIGDTWIHGVASDPFKVGLYKEYLREMTKIPNEEISKVEKDNFYREMLMVAEHTWGLDFKKYLSDYVNWDKASFKKAREKDELLAEYAGNYPTVYQFAKHEFEEQVKSFNWEERTYSLFEKSHQEQRDYLEKAISSLSPGNQQRFMNLREGYLNMKIKDEIQSFTKVSTNFLQFNEMGLKEESLNGNVELMLDGAIIYNGQRLGCLAYVLYGTEMFEEYKKTYSHDLEKNYDWAMPDFYKCGFETRGAIKENSEYTPVLSAAYIKANELILHLQYDSHLYLETGCPREIFVKYTFNDDEICVRLNVIGKDANRMPESLWISFFEDNDYENVKLKKLNTIIDPYAVVKYGNRNYHAVESVLFDDGAIVIEPKHSPLVSLGEKRLYDFNQKYASHQDGAHFNLYNNLWGTNFKMWYEEDIKSEFSIKF